MSSSCIHLKAFCCGLPGTSTLSPLSKENAAMIAKSSSFVTTNSIGGRFVGTFVGRGVGVVVGFDVGAEVEIATVGSAVNGAEVVGGNVCLVEGV